LKEINITPADVAEHLMPKTASGDAEIYLKSLIQALQLAKEEAREKSVEDAKKL
jgi:chaperone BCS1